jgi:hypothetical protein
MRTAGRAILERVVWWEVLVVALLGLGTVYLHLKVPGVVPSGPDGGNWLAMARDRFLGESVMSAAVTYPPFFPWLLSVLLLVTTPLVAIVSGALFAKCALVLATYFSARSMGPFYAGLAALMVGVGGAQLEAYAWGAYPQLLGTAFGTAAVYLMVRYLETARRGRLFGAIGFAALTYATHTLVGGLLVFALPLAAAHRLWMLRSSPGAWIKGMSKAALLAAPGALIALYNFVLAPQPGVEPVLNPLAQTWTFSLQQTVSDAPLPWLLVATLAVGALVYRRWSDGRSATVAVGVSWVIVGVLFFAVIAEARALLLAQLGLVLLAMLCFQRLLEAARSAKTRNPGRSLVRVAHSGLIILGVATLSSISVGGVNSYVNSASWYRVVDRPELAALDTLGALADEGDLVVAAQGHHGNQIGWWVQGYAGIPAYTAVDLRFLTFPEEREQALIANQIFDGTFDEAESIGALESIGADYVVVDRRGPNDGWLNSGLAERFRRVFESPTVVILEVPSS